MIKGRNWAFVIYPESLPENYEDIIINTGLPMAISPLHDKDINADGTEKKAHYHVLCYYESPTTKESVKKNITDKLNGTIPIKLESIKGMYRYHLHLDNPEKYQYKDSDRKFYNGFDIKRVDNLTYTEIAQTLKQIQRFIIENKIIEYSDLLDILLDNDLIEMWDVARNHTILLNTYISSRRYKTTTEKINEEKIDKKKK